MSHWLCRATSQGYVGIDALGGQVAAGADAPAHEHHVAAGVHGQVLAGGDWGEGLRLRLEAAS